MSDVMFVNGEEKPIKEPRSQNGLKNDIIDLVNEMPEPSRQCELTDFLYRLQYILDKNNVTVKG
jgi:hypothetical protein